MKLVASVTITGLSLATTTIVALKAPQAMPTRMAPIKTMTSGRPASESRTAARPERIRQAGWLRSMKPPEMPMMPCPMARTPTIDMVKAMASSVWWAKKSGR